MLSYLSVKNLALIDEVNLQFNSGLNILTGETGAGKSIIIDAVNLVLGERADRELIQTGKEYARVEALFHLDNTARVKHILEEFGIELESDGSLVLMRELSLNGRNLCRVNGRTVTLSILKEISGRLVDIHGQHQHQSLLLVDYHREVIDRLGGRRILGLKDKVSKLYQEWKSIQKRIKKISGSGSDVERQKDILAYQIDEISKANLQLNEEDELNRERKILQNSEKVITTIHEAYDKLYSGTSSSPSVSDILGEVSNRFAQIAHLDGTFSSMSQNLENLVYQLEDLIFEIRNYRDQFDFDPYRLDNIEKRLELIQSLKRKYGSSIEEILSYKSKIEEELKELANSQELLIELKAAESETYKNLIEACRELSDERRKLAADFESQLMKQLAELGMEKSRFKVVIDSPPNSENDLLVDQTRVTSDGYDLVEFMISTNPGEPLKPLSKIVSGGEMSRIMLAFKTIIADIDDIPTLIFDEIDVGISGRMAHVVGEKMGTISRSHQIICVTHLPQIAAMADVHFRIEKVFENKHTRTRVTSLDETAKQEEIARMIGGKTVSRISLDHAGELIQSAHEFKNKIKIRS